MRAKQRSGTQFLNCFRLIRQVKVARKGKNTRGLSETIERVVVEDAGGGGGGVEGEVNRRTERGKECEKSEVS